MSEQEKLEIRLNEMEKRIDRIIKFLSKQHYYVRVEDTYLFAELKYGVNFLDLLRSNDRADLEKYTLLFTKCKKELEEV